jgi:cell division protein FtsW (lipid II flippase)
MSTLFGRYFKGDRVIWTVVIILSAVSLLAVYSSTGSLAYRFHGGSTTYFLIKQLIFLGLGLSIVFITILSATRFTIRFLLFCLNFGAIAAYNASVWSNAEPGIALVGGAWTWNYIPNIGRGQVGD